jgi:predicted ester cyclase
VHVSEIVIFRLADGKIVEAWEEYDALGMRQQLGVLPAPPTPPAR